MKILAIFVIFYFPLVLWAGGGGAGPSVVMAGFTMSETPTFAANKTVEFITVGGGGSQPGSTIVWNEKAWFNLDRDNTWIHSVGTEGFNTEYVIANKDSLFKDDPIKIQFIDIKQGIILYSMFQAGKEVKISANEFEIEEKEPLLYQALVESFDMGNEPVLLKQVIEL